MNFGGGAGVSGAVYQLTLDACELELQPGNNFWSGGTTLFTNWSHADQLVTGPLNFEQCSLKLFENDAVNMTFQESDGRCIIKDNSASLEHSEEGSQAYMRLCP